MESAQLETTLVFGLRYLEEEDLELNDAIGCTIPSLVPDDPGGNNSTSYVTGCDAPDFD